MNHSIDADTHERERTKLGGALVAVGALLMLGGLAFHPEPAPDVTGQMAKISSNASLWTWIHWAIATGASLIAVAGLVILQARSRLTQRWWTQTAWSATFVAAIWMAVNSVVEATAVKQAALAGSALQFELWEAFAIGAALSIPFFTLAVAVIAGSEARSSEGVTHTLVSWLAAVVAVASTIGGLLWFTLEIRAAGLVWALSTLVLFLWLLWFGIELFRAARPEAYGE